MATITYNGVVLRLLTTNEMSRRAVYTEDETQYLYTEWQADIIGQYTPDLNVYKPQENRQDGQPPFFTAAGGTAFDQLGLGNVNAVPTVPDNPDAVDLGSPVLTDKTVRHFLMVPRRVLRITLGDALDLADDQLNQFPGEQPPPFPVAGLTSRELVWLQCPLDGYTCDAKNGPQPLRCDIINVVDPTTFTVRFVIRCWVNECRMGVDSSPLLANRFSQTHDIDDDQNLTITTLGTATFRKDWLTASGNNMDFYRRQLFLPTPTGFQRRGVRVAPSPDGTTLTYTYRDVQAGNNFVAANRLRQADDGSFYPLNATRIEALQVQRLETRSDPSQAALEWTARTFAGVAHGAKTINEAGTALAAVTVGTTAAIAIAADLSAQASSMLADLGHTIIDVMPRYTVSIRCTVFGNRRAKRRDLYFLALSVCFGRMRGAINATNLPIFRLNVVTDLVGKMVQVELTYQFAFTLTGAAGTILGMLDLATGPNDDTIGGDWPFKDLIAQIFSIAKIGSIATIPGAGGAALVFDLLPKFQETITAFARAANIPVTLPDAGKPILIDQDAIATPAEANLSLNPLLAGDGRSYGPFTGFTLTAPYADPCQRPADPSALAYTQERLDSGSYPWDYVRFPIMTAVSVFTGNESPPPTGAGPNDPGSEVDPQNLPEVTAPPMQEQPEQFPPENPLI